MAISPPLACPVRGCGRPLERTTAAWTCPDGHTFDVARSGYVNLLQPQDRRSRTPGDRLAAVQARSRLLASGVGNTLFSSVVNMLTPLIPDEGGVIVDLGCGGGEFIGAFVQQRPVTGIGIDLSVTALTTAARAYRDVTWVVANADRRLPLLDQSVNTIVSIHARRNPPECARVLAPGGVLVVAVPAADDLIELREAVFGRRVERHPGDSIAAEHADGFLVEAELVHREQLHLSADRLRDLLAGTYRGARHAARTQLTSLEHMTVTLASTIFLMRPRSAPQ